MVLNINIMFSLIFEDYVFNNIVLFQMSEIIPPLISDTPPPPPCLDEEDDDEFGNFIGSNDLSYGCESM